MSEQMQKITKHTTISISLLVAIVSVAFWVGSLASRVEAQENRNSPTRAEYDTLYSQISDIKKGVDSINMYLLNKK